MHETPPDPHDAVRARIEEASLEGLVVPRDEAWPDPPDDWPESDPRLAVVTVKGKAFLYARAVMTPQYAETAARAEADDPAAAIAHTVRLDSATYPRPTPISTFTEAPFAWPAPEVECALSGLAERSDCSDIEMVTASDGTRFLFSTRHMTRDHALSRAEWLAVGCRESP